MIYPKWTEEAADSHYHVVTNEIKFGVSKAKIINISVLQIGVGVGEVRDNKQKIKIKMKRERKKNIKTDFTKYTSKLQQKPTSCFSHKALNFPWTRVYLIIVLDLFSTIPFISNPHLHHLYPYNLFMYTILPPENPSGDWFSQVSWTTYTCSSDQHSIS